MDETDRKYRILVVDDEAPARARLARMLANDVRVDVVGEAADAESALTFIHERLPDIVLLDIQMRGPGGFDVVARLPTPGPVVIFVTAYDEFAVKAFDTEVMDYLLKPVEKSRLQRAIDRAIEGLVQRELAAGDRSLAMSYALPTAGVGHVSSAVPERLSVLVGRRTVYVPIADIEWIQADGNYVRIMTGGRALLARDSMRRLSEVLDRRRFVRVHRSVIVNVDRVTASEPMVNGDMKLIMQDGAVINASRLYRQEILMHLPRGR